VTKSAIALGGYENITNARAIISLLLLQSGSTISESSATGVRSTLTKNTSAGGGVSPGQSAITFYTQFADPAKVVYTWNRSLPQARDSFVAGDTTFYIGYASEYALLKASNPNLDFDMAAIPTPQTASTRIDYARVYAFAIPKTAKNAPASYQVAAALANQTSVALAAHALGVSPALRSMVSARTDDANAAVYNPLTLIAKGWLSPAPGVTDRIFADMINNVISGRENVQQALKAADDSLGSAVAR
jgi:ABC-type glycerol-3-phosphate transport system substrate-binding protein